MVNERSLRIQVSERAGHRCEYCQLPDAFVSTPFQIDHIIAEKREGPSTLDNLAWSCLDSNSFKGPNIAGRDLETEQTIRLFDPRQDVWHEHFNWDGPVGQI
jgi:5-methylcytosine-specific restriction endonuclease McrA